MKVPFVPPSSAAPANPLSTQWAMNVLRTPSLRRRAIPRSTSSRVQSARSEQPSGFDHSAPISPVKTIGVTGELTSAQIWLNVNGQRRQASDVSKLIWSVNETIEHLSRYFELKPGDLVFTGTPEGVGAVARGDELEGGVAGLGTLKIRIV